ncbi:antirestriction protein ArdA [Listeria booriae]|uniref:Antirestriction protein ArdA n=1 Tax=Listeria booriae TaxID=1552123 RepID=A0A841YKH5_9LIST|nr:antirestriction protein ArdA [Listeria booriae]MBC1400901.1 antirestriction protein ArdA [Listeria booriae]MBC1616748.1 antirestriction protein ArdA [Listeria booriae]
MKDIQVYIVNLGKYTEGVSQGAWFTLPVSLTEVAEKIGLNEQYEEFAIHNAIAPFKITEYESLDRLNAIAEALDRESDNPIAKYAGDLVEEGWYTDILEVLEDLDRIYAYEDCNSMGDVAYDFLTENGYLTGLPDIISNHIDYDSLGRELELEGCYYDTGDGMILQI